MLEDDWEDIQSTLSDDVEWVEASSAGIRTPSLHEDDSSNPLVALNHEVLRRLREAEVRVNHAERRAVGAEAQLRVATDRIAALQSVVVVQEQENNRLTAIISREERSKKALVCKPKKVSKPSKAQSRAPQSNRLPKNGYWAKNNHRTSCVASCRKI